ncbi:MAG: (acyl-carrier-protein) S-malonyltransferase-like protein [Rhodobacteraceae bacterium]|uniref:ACP S-malonyltransferase n=1 Tax=Cypionkella sp. TaxID=2811411 RepID=UPI00132BCF8B|nr:ACP S-malonyltransferase [Cypionkella sp.]KAF0173402.1 MAG: (acyl-carrier-protein) S-malonyltransferase-like protein [Paracoccaceae bacterium]MDO8326743.1 ACP S-malonyltransferase [Cypionkella sp.]
MKKAVLICPGRGTYTKTELGSLARFPDRSLLDSFDARRAALGQETLTALDAAASYSVAKHTRGDNASALIYACTLGDALSLQSVEIVAVTGNSMGWYSALACAGALTAQNGFEVVNTMGTLMQEQLIGGQILHPFMDENWQPNPARRAELLALAAEISTKPGHVLALSIDLGGMLVLAGNEAGLKAFEAAVPPEQGRFPMRLANHAAFHTALQAPVAAMGRAKLSASLFQQPQKPLIDGRGAIWWPGASDTANLYGYTLGHQVTEAYDFTAAIRTAAREFAPDLFIIPGPGTTLGGAVAQSLILAHWQGLGSKQDFQTRQAANPLLISMGLPEQRAQVT